MCFNISNLLFHLKQGGKNKVAREIADYLLECVKDANPPTTGNVIISFCIVGFDDHPYIPGRLKNRLISPFFS